MSKVKDRREFMSKGDQLKMAGIPRTHANCLDKTGVMRPGKTAQDHARRRGSVVE